ncbi:MAG TPA: 3-phosphoshikimate 1-carboxyvinyltransferase [Bryobacteraceae bacterium]|jgi:3-phosphoshikimate 1-carboxyvinyltransferase|nr:3-phosphoshikimate 1-carboxyvinyltransferase [Bryobacteraceae bacterium]
MRQTVSPAGRLEGLVRLPGDKSISHRYAMIASLAEGASKITNYSTGADCHSTLGCVRSLGIEVEEQGTTVTIRGRGLQGWKTPETDLDAGNSGSTIRMMSGLLAGQPFTSRIFGDESLSRRPMDRVMKPLAQMGAHIEARESRFPPLVIHGGELRAIDYTLPVASAQVKTCVLFGGLFAESETIVREPVRSRDHTEIALREFGAELRSAQRVITLEGRPKLSGRDLIVPSDLSSAAFFLVAGLLVPGSSLVIQNAGLNPTRSSLLDFLLSIGASIAVLRIESVNGEPIGDIQVRHTPVRGGVIEKDLAAALIDEIPVLAVLGAASEEGLIVRDAQELRIKETDRIATVAENFRRMGIEVETSPDGMRVPGRQKFRAASFDSFGDHRIAMAFAVAALAGDGPSTIENAEAASVSFPEFWEIIGGLSR